MTVISFRSVKTAFEIGFYNDHRTGNFVATLVNDAKHPNSIHRRQQIVVLPIFFQRVTGIDRREVAGLEELSLDQVIELGFILPEEVSADAVLAV